MPKYEVRGVKTFRGREGNGFNASLYRDGKRVATVDDAAHGGSLDWHWLDWKSERVEVELPRHNGDGTFTRKCTPEEATYFNHVLSQPDCGTFEPCDHFVCVLVDNVLMKRECRSKTIFRLKDGRIFEVKKKFNPDLKRWIEERYGNELESIINEEVAV